MSKEYGLYWKSNMPGLFEEVLNNKGAGILRIPLNITKSILAEMTAYVLNDLKDEKMIAFCGRLGLLDESMPSHEKHEDLKKIMDKYFSHD